MNSVALFFSSFFLISASIWVTFTSSMFVYSLAGKDPMGVRKDYKGNILACALPLTTSSTIWIGITYVWWTIQRCGV